MQAICTHKHLESKKDTCELVSRISETATTIPLAHGHVVRVDVLIFI
jgi:hypothetical protein